MTWLTSSQAFCPTSAIQRSPFARSNEKRQGLRRPSAQISRRPPRLPDERVVLRDAVGLAAGARVHVDAAELAEQVGRVLPVAVLAVLVAAAAAVPVAEVEHPVGPELQLAAVVVALGVGDLEQLAMPRPDARGALARAQLPDLLVAGLVREVHVELAVARELGVEGDREQALLAAGGDEAAQIGVRPRRDLPVADRADRALLLDHEEALVPGRRGDVDRRAQAFGDLGERERRAGGGRRRARRGRYGGQSAAEGGEGEGDSGIHAPQPTRDAARSGITSAPDGVVPRGRRGRIRSLVRGLERRRAPAAASARRPAPRGRDARAVRALRERPARAAARSRRVRRHFAFRQETRLALDLHVRPEQRGRGLGGSLLVQLLARARELGAEVVRGYAPLGDRAWDALASRHHLQEVECDRFSCWNWIAQLFPQTLRRAAFPRRRTGLRTSRRRGSWRPGCTARSARAHRTSRRRSTAGARGCSRPPARTGHGARHARARRRAGRASARCACASRSPRRSTTRSRAWPHRRAARATAWRSSGPPSGARRARRSPAGRRHEPRQRRHADLNERLGYAAVLDVRNLEGAP